MNLNLIFGQTIFNYSLYFYYQEIKIGTRTDILQFQYNALILVMIL